MGCSRPTRRRGRIGDLLGAGALTSLTVGLTSAGALLLAAAPRYPMARPAGGAAFHPVLELWPLLAALASVPAVVAVLLLVAWQRAAAFAACVSTGVLAAARVPLDVLLVADPATAVRPELVGVVGPGASGGLGAWLLLCGRLLTVLGGLAAAGALGWHGGAPGGCARALGWHGGALGGCARALGWHGGLPGGHGGQLGGLAGVVRAAGGGPARRPALGFAVLAAVGLLATPFVADGPAGPPRSALELPGWAALAGLWLAAGVVLAVVLACSAADPRAVIGGMVGAALGVLGVVLPRVVVAATTGRELVGFGLLLALAGAAGLFGAACWPHFRLTRRWGRVSALRGAASGAAGSDSAAGEVELAIRWRLLGGRLGVLAGACAIAAALADPLSLAPDLPHPQLPTLRVLVTVGAVLVPLGLATVSGSFGPSARPTLAVALVTVPMAAGEPLGDLLEVLGLDGVHPGPGFWLLITSVVAAPVAALALVLAGGFDRADVDLSDDRFDLYTAAAAAAAATLAVPAFWLPLIDGAGWGTTGVLQPPFGLASWGLLAAFAVTVGALLIGPRCRPDRAVSLLAGVAVVLVVRLSRLACVPSGVPGVGPGEGVWATVLCIPLVLATGVTALRPDPWWDLSSVRSRGDARERENGMAGRWRRGTEP